MKLLAFDERYETATKSNEKVLSKCLPNYLDKFMESLPIEKQIKNWTSSCYRHFKTLVIIVDKGAVKYQFACHT